MTTPLEEATELSIAVYEMEVDVATAKDDLWKLIKEHGLCPKNHIFRGKCCKFPDDCEQV